MTFSTWSGYDRSRLSVDVETFRKRCEHVTFEKDGFNPFRMELVKVTTGEGNGVVHIIFKAVPVKRSYRQATLGSRYRKRKGGFPANSKFDVGYIPFNWIKSTWAEITGNPVPKSQNVYIEATYGRPEHIAGYLLQYVSGQSELLHLSWSHGWLYRGCVKEWNTKFRPRVAETYSYRDSLDDDTFNEEMRQIYQDWDKWTFRKVT